MASITKKNIRGKIYYYARECRRVNGKPKIVWQKYLGRADDIVAAVSERQEGLPVPQPSDEAVVTELGAVAALYDLACRLGLVDIIDQHVPKRGSGPTVGTYLLVAIINRCVCPSSKAKLSEWFDKTVLRRLIEIESRQLTSQRYWDNADRVASEAIEAIEADLTRRVVDEFDLDLSRVLFDGTNFFTFIDSFNERSKLAQRGKGKEGRAALRIIGVALLVTADSHVPLLHHTYPGNQHDAPTFAGLTDALTSRLKCLVDSVEHITLVFDKGNNSQANLDAVEDTPFHFIGSLVPTQHPELLAVPLEKMRSLADDGLPGVSAFRTTKVVFGHRRTVLVTHNENLFVAQSKTLLREIAKRQQRFRELLARLERRRSGATRGGRAPSVSGTQKKIAGWLKARHMKELFDYEIVERDGLPEVTYQFNQQAWERLQATLLGKTLLFTDNGDWTDAEIVRGYRSQFHVEDAFRTMKDPHHIAIRPQYCWTDQKIRVHVFTCVVALTLLSLLRRQLCDAGIDLSIPRLVDLLDDIQEVAMIFPPEGKRTESIVRVSLSKMSAEQRALYEALRLERFRSP